MFDETSYENSIMTLLGRLGYDCENGYTIARDYHDPLYSSVLATSLARINPTLPSSAITEAIRKLRNFDIGSIIQKNIAFTYYMQNGITVESIESGKRKSSIVKLIDFDNPTINDFRAVNQYTIIERSEKRPDIIIFVNGMPLVLIELKSPSRQETDVSEGYRQIRNYMHEIPSVFNYNAMCVISDQAVSKVGTITSDESRYMEWKTTDGSYESTEYADFITFFTGLFDRERFIDILHNFVCYNMDGEHTFKVLAGYHQYYAVKKAIERADEASKTDGKGGVFWHTTGSGKSLSMVFYAQMLQRRLDSPTIVVVTDRNDLDSQLFGQFARCSSYLRQQPQQADSREHLIELLDKRQANGIIFTTMQKFIDGEQSLSTRRNIIVIADEAHRGQYGLEEKIKENGTIVVGTARIIRKALPNATYVGFTGTPISSKDRSTQEVFGDYIDIYDMTQAVEDGATRPVYYESRVIKLNLDQDTLALIDAEYDLMSSVADEVAIERSKKKLGRMDSVLGADSTLDSLVIDILAHYEDSRESELTGKAMIVAYSREIAIKIYYKLLQLRPSWGEKIAVVMTSGNNDPEDWRAVIGNKTHKVDMANKFKDNDSPLKIAIVVDMWLTGFDVPSLATMYVYKPMSGHNLMQAIARVNRVYKDKEGGLVVDYVGIAGALKTAMNDFTHRDKAKFGDNDIAKVAYPKFKEKLEVCGGMLHGFDYSDLMTCDVLGRSSLISGATNFLLAVDKETLREDFMKESLMLKQSLSLCKSLANDSERMTAALFETVRTILVRYFCGGGQEKLSFNDINTHINELLKASIKSDGVINLFSDIKAGISLFDSGFLEDISRMKEKNLALEILRKLLAEQVTLYRRTNLVKSEKFSEMINRIMKSYINGLITNEEVITELIKMAEDIRAADFEGESLGLSTDELAFYDAITKPENVKDFFDNEQLVAIAKELTDALRRNKTVDWNKKESARAQMRIMIKRLLKKYKYPPEDMAAALEIVMGQCEMWAENIE